MDGNETSDLWFRLVQYITIYKCNNLSPYTTTSSTCHKLHSQCTLYSSSADVSDPDLQSLASFSSSLSPLLFASSESLNSKSFSDGALALLCKTPSRRQCCLPAELHGLTCDWKRMWDRESCARENTKVHYTWGFGWKGINAFFLLPLAIVFELRHFKWGQLEALCFHSLFDVSNPALEFLQSLLLFGFGFGCIGFPFVQATAHIRCTSFLEQD